MELSIHSLFPTAVGFANLGRPLSDEELNFIRNLETRPNQGNMTSTNHFVLREPALSSIRDFIEEAVAGYFSTIINPKDKVKLRVTQSWCNYSSAGQHHHRHAHPNSYISGVFYVQTNADDRIMFDRGAWQQIKLTPENYNTYNSDTWWFEACVGRLILFPSSLDHNVPTVVGSTTRISISFNTFPVGKIGDTLDLTELILGE